MPLALYKMILDFHVHVFPDKIAEKAVNKLSMISKITPNTDGTFDDTDKKLKLWGVDKAVILSIATAASQQININNIAAENNKKENYYAFGSIYPFSEDAVEEVYRIKQLGLPGIKLHPEYQNFYVDDPRMFPVYEACRELGLIVYLHAGTDVGLPAPFHGTPDRISLILDNFPGLRVVAAHFGGYRCWDMVNYFLIGRDIYLDTSFTFEHLESERMKKMIYKHGVEKVLFASDCPWDSSKNSLEALKQLKLSSSEDEKILSKNGLELLAEFKNK